MARKQVTGVNFRRPSKGFCAGVTRCFATLCYLAVVKMMTIHALMSCGFRLASAKRGSSIGELTLETEECVPLNIFKWTTQTQSEGIGQSFWLLLFTIEKGRGRWHSFL